MSTFSYGGLSLEPGVETVSLRRRVVYDHSSYLHTKWALHVRGVYNPAATSYTFQEGNALAVVKQPGNNAAFTDATIRHQLMQPRQKLVYSTAGPGADGKPALSRDGLPSFGGSLLVLDVPPSTNPDDPTASDSVYLTDVTGGPWPIACDVVRVGGTRTFLVEWVGEADVNETFNFYSQPVVLLSHFWAQTADIDRDGFVTRHTRGRAVFRADVLQNMKAKPDDFREALGHPPIRNGRRENIRVTQHERPTEISYSFTDREASHNITAANVTRLEAFATVTQSTPGEEENLLATVGFVGGRGWNRIGNVHALASGILPTLRVLLTVRVWGNRRATRKSLLGVARRVLALKMPKAVSADQAEATPTTVVTTTFDLMGRYVQMQAMHDLGPFTTIIDTTSDDFYTQYPELVADDVGNVATTADRAGRTPVAGKLTRGTWLEALVAQGFGSSTQYPGFPAAVDSRDSTFPPVV